MCPDFGNFRQVDSIRYHGQRNSKNFFPFQIPEQVQSKRQDKNQVSY